MRRDLTQLKWRVGALAAAAAVLLTLAWRHDPPSGVMTMTASWPAPHPHVSELKPVARAATTDGEMTLTGGPVYFDVTPPTPYETVTVEATVRPQDAASVRLGAMATADGRFDVSTAYVRPVATLGWPAVASGDLVLQQRSKVFTSVDDFLAATTTAASSLVFPGDVAAATPPATASGAARAYAVSARGAHRLYARVPAGERLRLALLIQDMNRQSGADGARLTIFRAGSDLPLTTVSLGDDGITDPTLKALPPRELSLDWQPESAGEYWLAFDGSDDIFIRQVTTPLHEFGFLGRLYLGDEVGYGDGSAAATILVAGRRLQARAMNAEALQTISIAERGLLLPAVGEAVERELTGPSIVVAPHRGLVLTTDGRISLNATASVAAGVLDPRDDHASLTQAGVDFILSRVGDVTSRWQDEGSVRLRATFRTDELALTPSGAYRFVLDVAPGADGQHAILSGVRVTWQRARVSFVSWLPRIFRSDAKLTAGTEPPRAGLADFDEQIP